MGDCLRRSGDVQRLWLRSGGERAGSRTESAEIEALYGHGISPWWDLVAGVRHDFALGGESRSWAAIGVIGMAPYRFEVSATAYLDPSGRSAAKLEIEYEMLLSNRLILQPAVEMSFSSHADAAGHGGGGFPRLEGGLRLRYEISRRIAPYIGVIHAGRVDGTSDDGRQGAEAVGGTRWVAGLRAWF